MILFEWSRSHTPTSLLWRCLDNWVWPELGIIMRDVCSIPRQAIVGSVKYWRLFGIIRVLFPGPVGQVSIVAALIAEGLFEGPGIIAVPG